MLQAARVRPGDVVLEPSAGTGMLAVLAECALGSKAAGALHLNELAAVRAGLWTGCSPRPKRPTTTPRPSGTAFPTSSPPSCS